MDRMVVLTESEFDEINNWSGSGYVIGIAAQGDGVHSPVGMAGAIDGALSENNRGVDSGCLREFRGQGYRGPGIMGNDDGGDRSKRNTNDPNDGARRKRYTIGRRSGGDDETNNDDVTLVKTRMDSDDQLLLLTTASDEEEHDVGNNTRIVGDPSSTTRRPLRPRRKVRLPVRFRE